MSETSKTEALIERGRALLDAHGDVLGDLASGVTEPGGAE